jgi:hypothetical protein
MTPFGMMQTVQPRGAGVRAAARDVGAPLQGSRIARARTRRPLRKSRRSIGMVLAARTGSSQRPTNIDSDQDLLGLAAQLKLSARLEMASFLAELGNPVQFAARVWLPRHFRNGPALL